MTQRGPFLFLVALLLLAGIAIAAYRQNEYRIPMLPGAQQTVWEVEARIEFLARGEAAQAFLTLPPNQDGFRVISETGASSGFGFSFDVQAQHAQRRAHWSKRTVQGEQILFYKLQLVKDPSYRVERIPPQQIPRVAWNEPYRTAAQQIVQSALPISADARTLAQQLINAMNLIPADQNISLLRDRYDEPSLLANLLLSADVPARKVQVLALEDGRRRQALRNYVQVWDNDRWYLFNPRLGPATQLDNLLLWQTDTPALLEVLGGGRSRVSFSMISQARSMLALVEASPGFGFSLYNLPIAEQGMFKLIMLLPVGALVVVFMRLLVGVRTAGTFMPVLIALAFLQTELIPGVLSFVLVVAIGLFIRSYLSQLNLLLVARIATLVILVIGMISVFSIMSYRLGLMGGLTISFFPMIILAWTIERMSIIWEEEGPREVLVQGGGSLLVAILAFLLMDLNIVRHLAFNFPELHLCVLALVMVLGRYTGYRLLELNRFAGFKSA
jgi:hypothetical protein